MKSTTGSSEAISWVISWCSESQAFRTRRNHWVQPDHCTDHKNSQHLLSQTQCYTLCVHHFILSTHSSPPVHGWRNWGLARLSHLLVTFYSTSKWESQTIQLKDDLSGSRYAAGTILSNPAFLLAESQGGDRYFCLGSRGSKEDKWEAEDLC